MLEEAPHLPAALAATAGHIQLIDRKIARLMTARADAVDQMLAALSRGHRARPMTATQLYEAYRLLRGMHMYPEGLRERWWEATGVPESKLAGLARREAEITDGPWFGHHPLHDGETLPLKEQSVVYVLFGDDNEPVYVGSTNHLKYRLRAHVKDGKRYTRWAAHLCEDRAAAFEMENRFLAQYKPVLNKKRAA